jgi:hypothetical protein
MKLLGLSLALVLVALFAGPASGAPNPTAAAPVSIGFNPHRPVAGQVFTGITVVNLGASSISVTCSARLGGRQLTTRETHFNSLGYGSQVAAISCAWRIPSDVNGRILHTGVAFEASGWKGGEGPHVWTVRG